MKVLMTLLLLALGVKAASLDDLTYTTAGGKVTITDCDTGATGELVIPDTIGGNPVTSIGRQAFRSCGGLTNVIIPNSVTSIGLGSFQRCSGLTNITISESVTSIGLGSFQDCKNLTSITIPDSVISIGDGAFINCNSLTNINFLGTVAPSLGNRVFDNISDEATYIAPAGATGYSNPFGGVSFGLKDGDGDGVGDIYDAFPDDPNETKDSDGDGVGDNSDAFPNDANEAIDTDSDGVGDNSDAFPDDSNETKDSDGDGVGDNSDALPNDATETIDTDGDGIGNNADLDDDGDGVDDDSDPFPNDANETKDTDGDGVGDNGDIFANFNDSLIRYSDEGDSVTITDCETSASGILIIPDTINDLPVTRIRFGAFMDCTNLTSITIPDGVTALEDWTFVNCSSLESMKIPANIASIHQVAFADNTALNSFEVSPDNQFFSSESGVLFNKEQTTLILYPENKDGDYQVPPSVSILSPYAFNKSVIKNITLPAGLEAIPEGAFYGCSRLEKITIPENVNVIGKQAFEDCSNLKNFFMEGPPPSVGSSAFNNVASNALVNVPPQWRANYGDTGETWHGLFVVEQDEEECDNEELTNTITTLVAQLAQKDAQIAEKNAQIVELEKRPSLEDIQEARAGSLVLTPTGNGTVILKMMIEESSDLSVWENSEESIEVELPLAEGKKFLRFALK
ncbi:leucine-rich repeat protein [Akkermansiaceae bacterium]|nr:leucine-rich repeat protein [Akkermansiaceae bacterium]